MTVKENIWNIRLNWVKLRDASKNKFERLHWNLKIAYYDYEVARRYGNVEGKKKAQNRIASLKRSVRYNTLGSELRAVQKTLKTSKKQIEYDKALGYTFSEEERNGKKYLYKQKRAGSKKEHTYIAKDWKDLEIKQHHEAQEQVWNDHFALNGLAPVEIETFELISKEINETEETEKFINKYLKTKKERCEYFGYHVSMKQVKAHFFANTDPIIEKAGQQLGMYHRSHRVGHSYEWHKLTHIKHLPKQEIKNILRATRKALIRRGNIDNKLESIARVIGEGEDTIENVNRFIVYLMNQIGYYHITDNHAIMALIKYVNSINIKNPESMYSVLKPMEVKEFAENAVRRFKAMGGHFKSFS